MLKHIVLNGENQNWAFQKFEKDIIQKYQQFEREIFERMKKWNEETWE